MKYFLFLLPSSSLYLIFAYSSLLSITEVSYLVANFSFSIIFIYLIMKKKVSSVVIYNLLLIYIILIVGQEYELRSGYTWDYKEKVSIESEKGIQVYPPAKAATWLLELTPPVLNGVEFFPLSSPNQSKIVLCRESDGWQQFESDRYGFRNDDEIWDLETIDNLFIGDSFTVGYCVPEADHFIWLAEKYGSTLRLGNQTGPLTELGVFQEYIISEKKKVKRIFWIFTENDIYNTVENRAADIDLELQSTILTSYLEGKTQNLVENKEEVDNFIKEILLNEINKYNWKVRSPIHNSLPKRITGFYFYVKLEELIRFRVLNQQLSETTEYPGPDLSITNDYRLMVLDKVFNIMNNYKEQNGSELFFVFLPSKSQLYKETSHPLKESVINLAKNNGFEIIDVEPHFLEYEENLEDLFGTGHYSKLGYSLVNENINRAFQK